MSSLIRVDLFGRIPPVIMIEGISVRTKSIPKKVLIETWKKLTRKPFPKINAYRLDDDDFDRIIRLRRCVEDEQRELEEWNRILTTEGTDACVFNTAEKTGVDFMILIRKSHFHGIEEIIEHELLHIVKGDL